MTSGGRMSSGMNSSMSSGVNQSTVPGPTNTTPAASETEPFTETSPNASTPAPSTEAVTSDRETPDATSADTTESTDVNVDPSAELYDAARLPRFDIELSQEAIDALNSVEGSEDPNQNVYVRANLRYGAETVADVGLRLKGEGSFQRLDRKPALKLKFDEFVADQSFRGLKRFTLNNAFEDPSFLAERLAYEVYRAVGVPAPRCNNALVYINDVFYGVYVNVEAEDKPFLRRWFPDVSGNLYEEGQEDFVLGAEAAFNLETNETENDRTDLINLIDAVDGSQPETFLEDVGVYLDTANYLKFTAVEAAVNQWDMYSYTVFWVNNLRIYNDPTTGKFHFIPWGHDLSMKPYRDSGKPFIRAFELARQYDAPNGPITSGVLLRRCLESATCLAAYREALEEVIAVYDELDLEARAQVYYDQIKASVYEDARKNICCGQARPLENEEFEAAYQSVLTTIRGRTEALRDDIESNAN